MTVLTTEIVSVGQVPVKPYQGKFGDTWFIEGNFADGSFFSRGAKSVDNAEKLHRQLSDLVGKQHSFVVEDSGREYQGNKKWNLKEVPGQQNQWQGGRGPSSFGSGAPQRGGSSAAASSYRYSEQGTREERDSIVRQVALKCAVEVAVARGGQDNALKLADEYYAWLTKAPPAAPEPAPYERYSNEIQQAVRLKDSARLDALTQMIKASLAKGSLNIDQVAALDDELLDAKKAVNSALAQDQWTKQKQERARQTEPLHSNAAIADTLNQAQDAF